MSKADNPTLHYYALKLAIALKSEDGTDFCREYDNIPTSQLTAEQVDWIKEKARSDSALPHPTLTARMRWYKDKVIPTTSPTLPPSATTNFLDQKSHAVISQRTESEYHSAVSNLKARINSMVDIPIMKNFTAGPYAEENYVASSIKASDVNKNYTKSETRNSLFNGFHDGDDIEMIDMSKESRKAEYTEINIDDAIDFRLHQNNESDDNNSGDVKNSDPSVKKKKKKKKRKSVPDEKVLIPNEEDQATGDNTEKKGQSRAQRRKKLKQTLKEQEEKVTPRGKLEAGDGDHVDAQVIELPAQPEIRKPKRTIATVRRENERNRRILAQGNPPHPSLAGNYPHVIPVPPTSESNARSNTTSAPPILNTEHWSGYVSGDIEPTAAKSKSVQSAKSPISKSARVDSDDGKSPSEKDSFPTWVIEHDSRKEKKRNRKSKVKERAQNDTGSNSEHSNSDQTTQTKKNSHTENSKRSSDRSASVSSHDCSQLIETYPPCDHETDDQAHIQGDQIEMKDTLVDDDGSWDMVGPGKTDRRDKRKCDVKQNANHHLSNQSSLFEKTSLNADTSDTKGNSSTSSTKHHLKTNSINDSSTPELGVHNEELWPGLSAANANFHSHSKSKKTISYAQRMKRNKSSDSDDDPSSMTAILNSDIDSEIDAQSECDLIAGDETPISISDNEDSILDQILGHKLSGLNFIVGSCEELTALIEPHTDAVIEVQNDVKFIFVDDAYEDDDIVKESSQKPVNGPIDGDSTFSIAIPETKSPLTGDIVNQLLSNQIAKKIFIHTDVTIPDYHALIKFHEKRLKSVLEREQNGSAKTIRYVS